MKVYLFVDIDEADNYIVISPHSENRVWEEVAKKNHTTVEWVKTDYKLKTVIEIDPTKSTEVIAHYGDLELKKEELV